MQKKEQWVRPCECETCQSGEYIEVAPDGKSATCTECGRKAVKK